MWCGDMWRGGVCGVEVCRGYVWCGGMCGVCGVSYVWCGSVCGVEVCVV